MPMRSEPPILVGSHKFSASWCYWMASCHHWSWLHILGLTVLTVIIIYVMFYIEYPRAGLIRIESADQVLVKLREAMK